MKEQGTDFREMLSRLPEGYVCTADEIFTEVLNTEWNGYTIEMIYTPGHSPGSCCIRIDNMYVFTGDSLILDTPVITRFPGGSLELYESETLPFLRNLPGDTVILPGHGAPFCLKEYTF